MPTIFWKIKFIRWTAKAVGICSKKKTKISLKKPRKLFLRGFKAYWTRIWSTKNSYDVELNTGRFSRKFPIRPLTLKFGLYCFGVRITCFHTMCSLGSRRRFFRKLQVRQNAALREYADPLINTGIVFLTFKALIHTIWRSENKKFWKIDV